MLRALNPISISPRLALAHLPVYSPSGPPVNWGPCRRLLTLPVCFVVYHHTMPYRPSLWSLDNTTHTLTWHQTLRISNVHERASNRDKVTRRAPLLHAVRPPLGPPFDISPPSAPMRLRAKPPLPNPQLPLNPFKLGEPHSRRSSESATEAHGIIACSRISPSTSRQVGGWIAWVHGEGGIVAQAQVRQARPVARAMIAQAQAPWS